MALGPDDRVHYAYLEYACRNGASGIDFTSTTDGRVWQNPLFLTGAGGLSDKESITVDFLGRIYVAWDEATLNNTLFVTWSEDGGQTWAPVTHPTPNPVLGVIVTTGPDGTVYLAWWDLNTNNTMFDYSVDRGVTWHADVRVNDVPGSALAIGSWQIPIPAMVVDPSSGAIYVAWPDVRNGDEDIFVSRSSDRGTTWSPNIRINDDSGTTTQYMVDLAVDRTGKVHAAWEDQRTGAWNVFYSNSTNGGITWAPNVRVSSVDTPSSYVRPGDYFAIEAGPSDDIYLVWTDGRGPDFDIYFARNPGSPFEVVTVTTLPAGLEFAVDGGTHLRDTTFWMAPGSSHVVSVPAVQAGSPGVRFRFSSWTDGGAASHPIVVTQAMDLTASFVTDYYLTVASPMPGAGGDGWYLTGTTAVATVTSDVFSSGPGERYIFHGWTGSASGIGTSSDPIRMDQPKQATATWVTEYLVTVESEVGSVLGGGWYAAGRTATLQAPAQVSQGGQVYTFAGWTGNVSSSERTLTLTVDRPIHIKAAWMPVGPFGLSVVTWILLAVVVALVAAFFVLRRRRGRTSG